MNAPACALPTAENDSRPSRPVFFQNRASAERHAIKRAMALSADGLARPVEFTQRVFQGGSHFIAVQPAMPSGDQQVVELTAAEVDRLQQAGIREAITRCGHEIEAHVNGAKISKPGSCFERIHLERVAQVRERVRVLELRLTVGMVQS